MLCYLVGRCCLVVYVVRLVMLFDGRCNAGLCCLVQQCCLLGCCCNVG